MRDRTADPLLAKQVLSQLSYTPISVWRQNLQNWTIRFTKIHNADLGLECLFVSWDLTFVMSCLVTLRCSVNNFCSSNLFRCLWQLLSLVLAGRYFRAPRLGTSFSIERRWSSRTFRYGYLVTTSPQSPILPSAAPSCVRLLTSGITGSHGVTGGVYKARERIHRGMLIRDY